VERKTRVLVVEDDARLRDLLWELLASWGYEVEAAEDGIQALNKVGSFDPTVIISDLYMPRMDGFELLKTIWREFLDRVVIIMTGEATLDNAVVASRFGACSVIEKPLNPARLKAELKMCLEQREPGVRDRRN
jgi:two-component system chemotaxis response regulator CheY